MIRGRRRFQSPPLYAAIFFLSSPNLKSEASVEHFVQGSSRAITFGSVVMEGPCPVCKRPAGQCKIKDKVKSFFCIDTIEMFHDHVNIPCYIRDQFNKLCSNVVTLETIDGYLYTVEVDVRPDVTVLRGSKWGEFVADHGIVLGDCLMFHFPNDDKHTIVIHPTNKKRKNKMRIDNSVSVEAFNYDIDYKLAHAVISKSVSLSDEARANLRAHVLDSGAGAGAIFVHRLSETSIKRGIKFTEPVTTVLRAPQRGDILVYAQDPDVVCLMQ